MIHSKICIPQRTSTAANWNINHLSMESRSHRIYLSIQMNENVVVQPDCYSLSPLCNLRLKTRQRYHYIRRRHSQLRNNRFIRQHTVPDRWYGIRFETRLHAHLRIGCAMESMWLNGFNDGIVGPTRSSMCSFQPILETCVLREDVRPLWQAEVALYFHIPKLDMASASLMRRACGVG